MSWAHTPVVRVEDLGISFPGVSAPAVDSVTFEIFPGECVALVGESGSGKSLTAKAILGLVPAPATVRGTIRFEEDPAPPNGSSAWADIRGARAGLVPQDALGGLDPLRRIEHEVGDALRLHRIVPRRERRERVIDALEAAGMPTPQRQLKRRSDELSGGLRQRALVASALIADPELIIADEPTTALDTSHRRRVLAALRDQTRAGAGVLLISHDIASVREFADRVLVMRNGRVIEQGDPRLILTSPSHPFTRELIAASPVGVPRGVRLLEAERPESAALKAATQRPDLASPSALIHQLNNGVSSNAPARLELTNITAKYAGVPGGDSVLTKLSLLVRAGETVGLVGESGAGKTTLLRVVLGLHAPQSGQVLIDGVDRSSAPLKARRSIARKLSLVPQDPLDSFPRGSTGQSVLLDALRAAGTPKRARRARADEIANEVGLDSSLLVRPAASLSGGQRQRLAIARALACQPKLLLLDEPVSALDVTVQARVLDLLDDLQQKHGTAYLFVSHDTDVITHMSDRVLRLKSGGVVQE